MSNEPNKPIEAEELKEKELECVTGGVIIVGGEGRRIEKKPAPYALTRR